MMMPKLNNGEMEIRSVFEEKKSKQMQPKKFSTINTLQTSSLD